MEHEPAQSGARRNGRGSQNRAPYAAARGGSDGTGAAPGGAVGADGRRTADVIRRTLGGCRVAGESCGRRGLHGSKGSSTVSTLSTPRAPYGVHLKFSLLPEHR